MVAYHIVVVGVVGHKVKAERMAVPIAAEALLVGPMFVASLDRKSVV